MLLVKNVLKKGVFKQQPRAHRYGAKTTPCKPIIAREKILQDSAYEEERPDKPFQKPRLGILE
jgi:hypothetical protein